MANGNGNSDRVRDHGEGQIKVPLADHPAAAWEPLLQVRVAERQDCLEVAIGDSRPEALRLCAEISPSQRHDLAREAWSIGFRALSNAYAQAQDSRLQDIGKTLLDDVERQLRNNIEAQQQVIKQVLSGYFDPKDGQVVERLQRFVDDDGEVARVLDRYLAPNGVLAQALAEQVGENSPLFHKLSPTDSEGVVQLLGERLETVLQQNRASFEKAFDAADQESSVGRFLSQLRQALRELEGDREKQLAAALSALDANNKDSLINRLVDQTNRAGMQLLRAVNPDLPDSPLGLLKTTLASMLGEQMQTQQQAMARQEELLTQVRETVARLETRRAAQQTSTQGGFEFEDQVASFVQQAVQGAPVVVEQTSHTAGSVSRCKVGDQVLRFNDESAFAGCKVVVEAKHDSSYTVARALEELALARKNREADVGLFVMARSHAPDGFQPFARHGKNVLVVWDAEDPATNPYLQAAVACALGLASRRKASRDQGDINAMSDIHHRIEQELNRLATMSAANDRIRSSSDVIADEVRKAEKKFNTLLSKAKDCLKALHVELQDEAEELASPIGVDAIDHDDTA